MKPLCKVCFWFGTIGENCCLQCPLYQEEEKIKCFCCKAEFNDPEIAQEHFDVCHR